VTGASRGIGAASARLLASAGARVALVSRRADALHALAGEIGAGAVALPCDLTDAAATGRMAAAAIAALGDAPDIVVSNAGIFELAPLAEMSLDVFERTVQTNLVAPFVLLRAFLPRMRERGAGHVVTIGSIADRTVYPENGAYSAAKYGARAMHEVLRAESRGSGVRATLISPGPVDTPLWDDVLAHGAGRQLPTRDVMLDPAAVADAVLYVVTRGAAVNVDELRLGHA
jgi:NADP-dependent 3-hydroxy acid dehydrogenase YdfG